MNSPPESVEGYYTRSRSLKIDDLPTEMVEKIFSFVPLQDLYNNVRFVSQHWFTIASRPFLWKHIKAGPEMDINLLLEWLEMAPRLKSLNIIKRHDAGIILDKVSKFNKTIEELRLHDCWGSPRFINLPSQPLCNIMVRCSNLSNIILTGCRFASCKFFKLLGQREIILKRLQKRKHNKIARGISFLGPASVKQLRIFLESKRESCNYHLTELSLVSNGTITKFLRADDENFSRSRMDIERILNQYPLF